MRLLRRCAILGSCFFLMICSLVAQTPRFYIQTDRTTVSEGEAFTLEAVLENIDANNIQLGDLRGFTVMQGPSTSTSVSIINGKRSSTISWQYIIMAPHKGRFKISPATAKVGSKVIKSNELQIEVTVATQKQNDVTLDDSKMSFIRLEVADNDVFIGQQLALDYVLYTRQNIESYDIISQPQTEGFFKQALGDFTDQPQKTVIKGKEYYRQIIKRDILFPQKTGVYELGPANIALEVPLENARSSFFFRDTKREQTITNSVKLTVRKLPDNPPGSFSGAVGSFEMQARVRKSKVAVGESIVLELEVVGDGDPKVIKAPDFLLPEGLEKYEPSVIRDESFGRGGIIKSNKIFEYVLIPSKDTVYTITPEFTYLSASTGRYETQKADPISIQVLKGQQGITSLPDEKVDMQFSPASDDHKLYNTQKGVITPLQYLMASGLLILLTLAGMYFKSQKIKNQLSGESMDNKVASLAVEHLSNARKYMDGGDLKAFYEEISQATTGYIMKKYNIPNTDAACEVVCEYMGNHHISPAIISSYRDIRQKCEMARFAGQTMDPASLYLAAESIINDLEKV